MARIFAAILFITVCVGTGSAATFTANGGVGTSTVGGPGADYPDLASAAEDFTTGPQAVTGNYTFLIADSTTETRQMAFGKNTNGFTVTLKPAPGVQPTIVFDYTKQNNNSGTFSATQGAPGQIIIGLNDLANTGAALEGGIVPTNNFVIDGSNTNGGTTRDLTFTIPTPGLINSRIIHILGSNDTVIKNCNILNNAGSPSFGVYVVVVKIPIAAASAATTYYNSTGTVITNCDIRALNNASARPIAINAIFDGQVTNAASFPTDGTAPIPSGYSITDNNVEGRNNAFYLNLAAGGTIARNTIRAVNGDSGVMSCVNHLNVRGETGWTLNVNDNVLTCTSNANATGMAAIRLGVSAGAPDGAGTYNVANNFITGPSATNMAGAFHQAIRGFSATSDYNIQHNSINFIDSGDLTATGDNVAAIALTAATRTGTASIRNNLIRLAQQDASGIAHAAAVGTLTTDGNNVALVGTATKFGRLAATDQPTLANWQAATSQEALGQTVDPFATTGSAWVNDTNLHFQPNNTKPVELNGGVGSGFTGVTTDIDGDARNATAPMPGADEVIPGSAVDHWSLY